MHHPSIPYLRLRGPSYPEELRGGEDQDPEDDGVLHHLETPLEDLDVDGQVEGEVGGGGAPRGVEPDQVP